MLDTSRLKKMLPEDVSASEAINLILSLISSEKTAVKVDHPENDIKT